jgi:hypothetical protein
VFQSAIRRSMECDDESVVANSMSTRLINLRFGPVVCIQNNRLGLAKKMMSSDNDHCPYTAFGFYYSGAASVPSRRKTSVCSASFRFCASLTHESSLSFVLSLLWSLFSFSISQSFFAFIF